MKHEKMLDVEKVDEVLVITPRTDIGSLMDIEMREEWQQWKEQIESDQIRLVLIDLDHLHYFGSAVLDWMVGIWKQVKPRGGKLVLANVSPVGTEILETANLDAVWPICGTREDALRRLRESAGDA